MMFTSKNDSASKVRGLRAGADDYLTKPFDMDELIARILSLIRRYTYFNGQDGFRCFPPLFRPYHQAGKKATIRNGRGVG